MDATPTSRKPTDVRRLTFTDMVNHFTGTVGPTAVTWAQSGTMTYAALLAMKGLTPGTPAAQAVGDAIVAPGSEYVNGLWKVSRV